MLRGVLYDGRNLLRTRYITVRTIIIVIGVLVAAMWAAVGLSIITSRQAAVDAASLGGRYLMIAFREEVARILDGVEGETNLIAERMQRQRDNFDLYAWGQENLIVPAIAQITILDPDGTLRSTTIEPHPRATDLSDRQHFKAALEILLREKIDPLFTDIVMPGAVDGAKLPRTAIERWPALTRGDLAMAIYRMAVIYRVRGLNQPVPGEAHILRAGDDAKARAKAQNFAL